MPPKQIFAISFRRKRSVSPDKTNSHGPRFLRGRVAAGVTEKRNCASCFYASLHRVPSTRPGGQAFFRMIHVVMQR